jgi:hypothetical protein
MACSPLQQFVPAFLQSAKNEITSDLQAFDCTIITFTAILIISSTIIGTASVHE